MGEIEVLECMNCLAYDYLLFRVVFFYLYKYLFFFLKKEGNRTLSENKERKLETNYKLHKRCTCAGLILIINLTASFFVRKHSPRQNRIKLYSY